MLDNYKKNRFAARQIGFYRQKRNLAVCRVQRAWIAIPYSRCIKKRLTIHLQLDKGTFVIHTVPRLKPRVQWSPLEEPKQLGSVVDFTICTAHDAAAPLRRARDHPRSPRRHQTDKDGPALQGDWGCCIESRLGTKRQGTDCG